MVSEAYRQPYLRTHVSDQRPALAKTPTQTLPPESWTLTAL